MRQKMILTATALGGLLAASPAAQAHVLGYTFIGIDVPGSAPGTTGVSDFGMNNLGQVVGGYQDSAGTEHGFIYTKGKYVTLDVPGAVSTTLDGINDFGQIVGTYSTATAFESFLYDHGRFINIANPDTFYPTGINDKGQILGVGFATGVHAIDTLGSFTTISVPGAANTFFQFGFNNREQVVGGYIDNGGMIQSFLDTNGVFTFIIAPGAGPGGGTVAFGINDWGRIVGNFFDNAGNSHGFIDTNGHFATIDDPNGSGTNAELINDVGQIYGFYSDAAGNLDSFLATPNFLPLALSAFDPPAADPPTAPEASTWVMMLMGFAGLGVATYGRRRRKRHDDANALAA